MAFNKLVSCVFALTTVLALFAAKAAADDMSCQDRIISTGSSAYDVQFLCGAPDFVDHRSEVRTVRRPVSVPCATARGIGRCIAYVEDGDELLVITQQGMIIRMQTSHLRAIGRATQGVRAALVP